MPAYPPFPPYAPVIAKTDYKEVLCNLFLSILFYPMRFFSACASLLLILVRGLVGTGHVGCLVGWLVGRLILCAVGTASRVVLVAVLITVSAIRSRILCTFVFCHVALHPGTCLCRIFLFAYCMVSIWCSPENIHGFCGFALLFQKECSILMLWYVKHIILYPLLIIYTPLRKSQVHRTWLFLSYHSWYLITVHNIQDCR